MEKSEISEHEVLVFQVLQKHGWMTNAQIAKVLKERVASRTVRAITLKFVKLGILDMAEVFPAHRYKLSPKAEKRNKGYWLRLQKVLEVFGEAP